MSRSGYSDGCDGWELIMYRGAVASAIRGKRGQQFLRDLITALDALPQPRLIESAFEKEGEVCALGSVAKMRGVSLDGLQPEYDDYSDGETVGALFGIAPALAREVMFENDMDFCAPRETPEKRWSRVRAWAVSNLRQPTPDARKG